MNNNNSLISELTLAHIHYSAIKITTHEILRSGNKISARESITAKNLLRF